MNPQWLEKMIGVISLLALLLAGCGTPAAPASIETASITTALPIMTWLGMQYPADSWHADAIEDNFLIHGLLTHLTLPECQVIVLAEDPTFIVQNLPWLIPNQPEDWLTNMRTDQETTTDNLIINLVIVKDEANNEQIAYYDVFDKTGFFGYDKHRLGYFLMSRNPDPEPCRAAFMDVLITLQVADWPKLPVDQG